MSQFLPLVADASMLQSAPLYSLLSGDQSLISDSAAFQPLDGLRTSTPDSMPVQQQAGLNHGVGLANQPQKMLEAEPMDNSMLLDMPDPFDLGEVQK